LVNSNNYGYFSYRENLETVKEDIKNRENSILVESNLGNGKTLFLKALSILLVKDGYKVFFFEKYRTSIEREIQKICDDYDNAVVIFDDYHTVREEISFFSQRRKKQILITSERTHIHEITFDDIEQTIGEYKTINIDFFHYCPVKK
jgi:predicted PilT family ATPase